MGEQLAHEPAGNAFIEKTLDGLAINKPEEKMRIAPRGFEIDDSEEKCILIIGLNPAGDEKDAEREKKERTYLYSISKGEKITSKWLYNSYYRPIYDFAKAVLGDKVKWPWCNKGWDELEKEIANSELSGNKKTLKDEYDNHKNHPYVIYIGDMFYYHETDSKSLPLSKKPNENPAAAKEYCKEMLRLHIDALKAANKTIEFVYINNAKVSHWLREDKEKTFEEVDGVKVFYGGMLSGKRSMDTFAKQRLVNEIKSNIRKEKMIRFKQIEALSLCKSP